MVGIEAQAPGEHGPEDAGILVGQGHDRLLPASAALELHQPLADAVLAFLGGHDGRLGALGEQGAQIGV